MYSQEQERISSMLNALKPSELLRVGIADFRMILRAPERFEEDMDNYVHPRGARCAVCIAGSVLHNRLGITDTFPLDDTPKFASRLDSMRQGEVFGWADYDSQNRVPAEVGSRYKQMVLSGWIVELSRASIKTYLRGATYLEKHGW